MAAADDTRSPKPPTTFDISGVKLPISALVAQAAWCWITWIVVNDKSQGMSSWSNEDFGQWLVASSVGVGVLTIVGGLVVGRRTGALVTAAACLLALGIWFLVFVFTAVSGSN